MSGRVIAMRKDEKGYQFEATFLINRWQTGVAFTSDYYPTWEECKRAAYRWNYANGNQYTICSVIIQPAPSLPMSGAAIYQQELKDYRYGRIV